MFTRVVEITTKSGKAHEVANTIHEKILPILRKQTGFVDETVLTSETESNRILGLSFWKTREDAERYHREQYPKVNEILSPLLETGPVLSCRFAMHRRIARFTFAIWLYVSITVVIVFTL